MNDSHLHFYSSFHQDDIKHAVDRLETWCSEHELAWNERASERFRNYIQLILYYQQKTNLTGFSTPEALIDGLFTDSLQILCAGTIQGCILDVGTGAGFPAIPIKILHPDIRMILVEPRPKRYAFLRKVESTLELEDISIERAKIQSLSLPFDIDYIMSKAFMPLNEWLELSRPWADKGTRVICYLSESEFMKNRDYIQQQGYTTVGMTEYNHRIYIILQMMRHG